MKQQDFSVETQLAALDLLENFAKPLRQRKKEERADIVKCFLLLLRCEIPHFLTED